MNIQQTLPPTIRYGTVALDLEIYRMNPRQLHRPSGEFACLSISDGENVWMIERAAQVEKALHRIRGCRWVFHNADFDLRHLRRWAEVPVRAVEMFWDTFLVEKLLWGGWYNSFGLRDLGRRYLNLYLSKESRDEFPKATEMTPDMRTYAARDPYVTWQIYQKQRPLLEGDAGSKYVWENIDGPALWAFIAFRGITLNVNKWRALAQKWENISQEIAAKYSGTNLNAPGQVVISGEPAAVDLACERAKARGARRAIKLEVSGAFHSPLMEPAAKGLAEALARVTIRDARCPVISNAWAKPVQDAKEIRRALEAQLLASVRWEDSMRYLLAQGGVEAFVELGTGKVLRGLLRALDANAASWNVEDPESLQATRAALAGAGRTA